MPRRRKTAPVKSIELNEPTEEELLAQLEQATHDDNNNDNDNHLDFDDNSDLPSTTTPTAPGNAQNPPKRTKRKYNKNSGQYARPQEYDENGNPILPGFEYASLSLVGPRRPPVEKEPTPPPSLDPNGRPWLYPKKTRQGEGSNLAPFYDEIKRWIQQGQSSRIIAENLIARGVETTDRHVAKQRLKMGFRQRARRKLTDEAIENMRKAKQSVAKPLPTKGDVSVRRVRIREMRQAEITRMTREGMSAAEISDNLSARGINMRSGAPTVLRLQKQWGLLAPDNNVSSRRAHARQEATRRQKEQLSNMAQELGIQDIDEWVKTKMQEPNMRDARLRFAYELMGDAQPAIARAGIEAAIKRSRRAQDKRHFLKMQEAAGSNSPQNSATTPGQPSASQSGPVEISDQEDESDNATDDGELEENDDDEDEEDDGEEEQAETSRPPPQTGEPMEVDAPRQLPQQPGALPVNGFPTQAVPGNFNATSSQHLGFNACRDPSSNEPPHSQETAEGYSQARLARPPPNATQEQGPASFASIAPRPTQPRLLAPGPPPHEHLHLALVPPPDQPVPIQQQPGSPPPPAGQLMPAADPGLPHVHHTDPTMSEIEASPYVQPTQEHADYMAQQYNLFPYRTRSKKQHTYATMAGAIITVGFEYLPKPPRPGAPMMIIPKVNIPAELQSQQQEASLPQKGSFRTPKYPPVVGPSIPVPAVVIPAEEAERHKRDQKILEDIQKKTDECLKLVSARANNQLLENSLTGLPPSRYDIQNAKKLLKEAANALFAAV